MGLDLPFEPIANSEFTDISRDEGKPGPGHPQVLEATGLSLMSFHPFFSREEGREKETQKHQ